MGNVKSKIHLPHRHAKADDGTPKLHGTLQVSVHEARDLPDTDKSLFLNNKDVSDPFVTLEIGKIRLLKTKTIDNNLNPKWDEYFRFDISQKADDKLIFRIRDKDIVNNDSLGKVEILGADLLKAKQIKGWLDVVKENGEPNGNAKLNITVRFFSSDEVTQSREIPLCYFSLTPDNKVTLFQDAETPDDPLHKSIVLAGNRPYKPQSAWRHLYEAIVGARRLIYMTGWSVDNETTLLRDGPASSETLGDLLKRKAEEGVHVLILVWDEKFSTNVTDGLGTHDNKTAQYFSSSKVRCILVPRQKRHASVLDHAWASTCFSHHQKSVIVDAEVPQELGDSRRRLVAFVGGLDVTCGRWDTPQHALFATLNTTHKNDFYQACLKVDKTQGPRQPWHDIHTKIEGPAAFDMLTNFVERWRRQVNEEDPDLMNISEADFYIGCPGPVSNDVDKWQVQLLRTINSDSAEFNKEKRKSLFSQKGRLTDDSIHRGYVHHIRRAKRFIYIENQYFLGASHEWLEDENYKAKHMIPFELVEAICRKIRERKRFAVYVVMPMFPEGDPHSGPLQAILFWQYRTIQMMYYKIATAIRTYGVKNVTPTDYLTFHCLGNRETAVPTDLPEPPANSVAAKLRASRRHQIYVHSKMMIVDDEVIIVGSANVNQRSMGGNRDTEIAIAAFQPGRIGKKGPARGDIYGLRMALWAEHTGRLLPEYNDPESLKCVRAVRDIGEKNLKTYNADEVTPLEGHLMLYPLAIDQQGNVSLFPEGKYFPDTTASIIGEKSSVLPMSVTT